MSSKDVLQSIRESLASTASVKSVFGEPIRAEGKTIVPVAKIAFGYGGGFGTGPVKSASHENHAEGGGGGGGMAAMPVGVLEITPTRTRFVRVVDMRVWLGVFAAGMLVGRLIWRDRRRRGPD